MVYSGVPSAWICQPYSSSSLVLSTIEEDEPIPPRGDSQSDRGTNREVVAIQKHKGVTFKHEKIRCGKVT